MLLLTLISSISKRNSDFFGIEGLPFEIPEGLVVRVPVQLLRAYLHALLEAPPLVFALCQPKWVKLCSNASVTSTEAPGGHAGLQHNNSYCWLSLASRRTIGKAVTLK